MVKLKGGERLGRWGDNIYHRKDGRWEGRYIAMRLPDGKAKYKSVYGESKTVVKKKLIAAIQVICSLHERQ